MISVKTAKNLLSLIQKNLDQLDGIRKQVSEPLLLPAMPFGSELERFRDANEALLSWDTKETQWWYFTGHLKNKEGKHFGFELTFFERKTQNDNLCGFRPSWVMEKMFISHFALTTPQEKKKFRYHHRGGYLEPEGIASSHRMHVAVGPWHAIREDDGTFRLFAEKAGDGLNLRLEPAKPLVYHGKDGYSKKAKGGAQASYYCAYTRLRAKGQLTVDGNTFDVVGSAWMDHEKMTMPGLDVFTYGWDWAAIQFDSGQELMFALTKKEDRSFDFENAFSTWVEVDGKTQKFGYQDIVIQDLKHWTSPASGARYPIHRRILVKPLNLDIEMTSVVPEQELDVSTTTLLAYWEGAMLVKGRLGDQPIEGRAYMELVGFDQRPRATVLPLLVGYSLESNRRLHFQKMRILGASAAVALVDGTVTPKQAELYVSHCQSLKLSESELREAKGYLISPPAFDEMSAWEMTEREKREVLHAAEQMAAVDGQIQPKEQKLLKDLGQAFRSRTAHSEIELPSE